MTYADAKRLGAAWALSPSGIGCLPLWQRRGVEEVANIVADSPLPQIAAALRDSGCAEHAIDDVIAAFVAGAAEAWSSHE